MISIRPIVKSLRAPPKSYAMRVISIRPIVESLRVILPKSLAMRVDSYLSDCRVVTGYSTPKPTMRPAAYESFVPPPHDFAQEGTF